MSGIRPIVRGSLISMIVVLLAGCIWVPRGGGGYHEGYYDRAHHRYWHNNAWHQCGYNDPHCH